MTTDAQAQPPAATSDTIPAEGQGAADTAPIFDAAILEACETVVEQYRKGSIDKAGAIFELGDFIRPLESGSPEIERQKKEGFSTFLTQLDNIDNERRDAQRRGKEHDEQEVSPDEDFGEEDASVGEADQPNVGGVRSSGVKRKRDSPEEESSSKRPLNESLLPAALQLGPGGHIDFGPFLRPEVATTIAFKENYLRDTSAVKQRILCSPQCTDIPESLWNDVICDRFVDLDKLYSAVYAIDGDRRETYKLGELELTTTSSKAARTVTSHGDWTIAWSKYQDAVFLLYPHRERELRQYAEHINRLFSVIQSDPGRVIAYDRAVRGVVGRTNARLLTDFNEWTHLHTLHIVTPGASSSRHSGQAQGNSNTTGQLKSKEACRRWNEGRCSRINCRYQHICSLCNSRAHAAIACSREEPGERK